MFALILTLCAVVGVVIFLGIELRAALALVRTLRQERNDAVRAYETSRLTTTRILAQIEAVRGEVNATGAAIEQSLRV